MLDSRAVCETRIEHRVIVADDDADSRDLARTILEANGLVVTEAHDGQELYDLLMSAEVGHFRLVVTDQMMPGMTGSEVLRRVGARAPFVILTGAPMPELRATAARNGVVAIVTKPFDLARFTKVVMDAVHRIRSLALAAGGEAGE